MNLAPLTPAEPALSSGLGISHDSGIAISDERLSEVARFKPSNAMGSAFVAWCVALTGLALWLISADGAALWSLGQIALSLALLLWFILLHEAGHGTLFATPVANRATGHVAGFFSLIPFYNWQMVHARHHVWTGWQDMDATTEALTPRSLRPIERLLINAAWRLWFPMFSVLYRINNFWNLPRLHRFFPEETHRRGFARSCSGLAILYLLLGISLGPVDLLVTVGPALLLTLALQDPIILSQHTHMPQKLAQGRKVRPFPPLEQGRFTRSLRFPAWFSKLFLMHFDAHELHHMYVRVPGYYLRATGVRCENEVNWLRWLAGAKRLTGEEFLFQNSHTTGFKL